MSQARVHTGEQEAALKDRYERLQRDEALENVWKSVDMERIQAVYQMQVTSNVSACSVFKLTSAVSNILVESLYYHTEKRKTISRTIPMNFTKVLRGLCLLVSIAIGIMAP